MASSRRQLEAAGLPRVNAYQIVAWRPRLDAAARQVTVGDLIERAGRGEIDQRSQVSFGEGHWRPTLSIPAIAEALTHSVPRRRPRPIADAEFDMTPMIDCTFLLLLFFMLSATYEQQKTIDTPPPPGQGAALKTLDDLQQQNIIAKIGRDGSLHIDKEAVSWEDVRHHLTEKRRQHGKAWLIIVMEDDGKWELTVRLQDEATQAGIERIRYGKGVPLSGQ